MHVRPSAPTISAPRALRVAVETLETRTLMSAWTDALAGLLEPQAAATTSDGSVIVVGRRYVPGLGNEVAVARLTPQATLDTTFGLNGLAAARFNNDGNGGT